ncbi:MAG: 1-acyl-sn-glycerol-3-phosphate acyltransferase [Arcobacteraceae bacterium]|nr:1-acyl-sn-glycerol-3-phosphate acyltransferase [Arcobacteraceae bacterium]
MNKIRGIFTITQMLITVSFVIIFMYIFRSNNRKIRKLWGALQMKLLGVDLEIVGVEDKEADMIIMNHQATMDIVIFEYLASRDIAWIAKKEIGDIPWFGHILKAPHMIMVERESKSSLVKLIKDSKVKLEDNRQIAIFPEGTRTDGTKLRKFKAGAKIIAQKYNLNVQPIIIVGSLDIWDSKKFIQKSGTVKIIYLDTVKADKKTTWYEDTEELMKNTLEKELDK